MKLWRHAAAFLLSLCAAATMAAAADTPPVPLTEETFPDPAFLQWVEKKDSDGDGSLSQEELDAVTAMVLRKQGIEQLDGLEYFRNPESLNCSENDLTALVLEDFPALTSLTCNENASLETLDLSGVPALEQLYCFHSALTELDLQDVPALTYHRPCLQQHHVEHLRPRHRRDAPDCGGKNRPGHRQNSTSARGPVSSPKAYSQHLPSSQRPAA